MSFNQYAKYYDLFNQDKPYKKEIEFVYKWAGRPKRILDIGCGTANYWKYWPRGVEVYGIEKSKEMRDESKYAEKIYLTNGLVPNKEIDLATALFDVANYIPKHYWWKTIPIKKGGHFIFDIWDKKKVLRDGFEMRLKNVGRASRYIGPLNVTDEIVELKIVVFDKGKHVFDEYHKMYIYSLQDIEKFCGKEFEIVDVKKTKKWQTWYKLKRK